MEILSTIALQAGNGVGKPTNITSSTLDIGGANYSLTAELKAETQALIRSIPDKASTSDLSAHAARTDNPHGITKAQIGLANCNNTADTDKKVLSATKWATKRTLTVSGGAKGTATFDGSEDILLNLTTSGSTVVEGDGLTTTVTGIGTSSDPYKVGVNYERFEHTSGLSKNISGSATVTGYAKGNNRVMVITVTNFALSTGATQAFTLTNAELAILFGGTYSDYDGVRISGMSTWFSAAGTQVFMWLSGNTGTGLSGTTSVNFRAVGSQQATSASVTFTLPITIA